MPGVIRSGGEALALRAMHHFDIYRLFAPDVKLDKAARILPYQLKFGVETPAVYTTQEYLNLVAYPRTALLLTFLLRLSLHNPLFIPFRVQRLCFFQRNNTFSSRLLVQRSKVYLTARYAGFYVLQRVTVL